MKITNDLNFPEPLVAAVRADDYLKGDCEFSTTELISPPRIAVLRRQWDTHLSEDVSDRIYALIGKAIHIILQASAEKKHYIVEKKFYHIHDGHKVGGRIDLFDRRTGTLDDWKYTTYHATKKARLVHPWDTLRTVPDEKEDWIAQANINRYLMFRNEFNVKHLRNVCLYRDWSKLQVHRGKSDYPPRQAEVLRVPLWSYGETEDYLSERIKLHLAARTELPMCSPAERWETPPVWAVMKKGTKRAISGGLKESELEAQVLAAEKTTAKQKYMVVARPGESKRCLYYCPVAGYCDFGRKLLAARMENGQNGEEELF